MIRRGADKKFSPDVFVKGPSKKAWTEQEDDILRQLTAMHGTGNWTLIAQSLPERTGKQCRERFHNHLDIGIKKGDWTEEEDRIILILQKALGNQWAKITRLLPGRTDNAVKNRFHALERARGRGKLDESLLQDQEYADRIIKEASRMSDPDVSGHGSISSSMDGGSSVTFDSRSRSTSAATSSVHGTYCQDPVASLMMEDEEHPSPSSPFMQQARWMASAGLQVSPMMALEDEDDDDEEDSPANSADGLMELDIISFEGDDYYQLSDSEGGQGTQVGTNGCMNLDPGCFSFEWNCARPGMNGGAPANSNSMAPARNSNAYWCGLESWGHAPQAPGQLQPPGQPQGYPSQAYPPMAYSLQSPAAQPQPYQSYPQTPQPQLQPHQSAQYPGSMAPQPPGPYAYPNAPPSQNPAPANGGGGWFSFTGRR